MSGSPWSQTPTPVPPCTCGLPVRAPQRPGRGTLLGALALPQSWAVGRPRTPVSVLEPASLRAAGSDRLGAAAPGGTARLSGLTAALSPALRWRPAQPGAPPGAVHHTPARPPAARSGAPDAPERRLQTGQLLLAKQRRPGLHCPVHRRRAGPTWSESGPPTGALKPVPSQRQQVGSWSVHTTAASLRAASNLTLTVCTQAAVRRPGQGRAGPQEPPHCTQPSPAAPRCRPATTACVRPLGSAAALPTGLSPLSRRLAPSPQLPCSAHGATALRSPRRMAVQVLPVHPASRT